MMPFIPVILWTDALVFVQIACIVAAAIYVRRREHLMASWRKVSSSRTGMAAFTVLAVFVAVGVIDSLHYRPRLPSAAGEARAVYSVEVRSVLDALASGLKARTEKTYSAPFATHLDSKETMAQPDGTQARDYPRLQYGGAHLADPGERRSDILMRAIAAVLAAIAGWLIVCAAVVAIVARSAAVSMRTAVVDIRDGRGRIAWDGVLLTLGAIAIVAVPLVVLSGWYHVLGTDKVGIDVLYLALKSVRTALVIGTLTTLATLPFAVVLGIVAGYFGGLADDVIQYIYTTLNSIPFVLLIAAAVLMMQVVIERHSEWFSTAAERADARLLALCLIIGMTTWTSLCRLLRSETLKLRELEYVEAARAFGVSNIRIMSRHILPNLMHIVLISLVMDFSSLVLAEAVLSYVGIGVDPSTVSFGTMINAARMELTREPIVWWSLVAAFVFMFTLVLTANLFSDAVSAAFDPRIATRVARAPARKARG